MKITVIGCGNAFSKENGNQMFMVEENGRRMLIDFGFQASLSLQKNNIDINTINDVYISHQHADHVGGLEELAFTRYDWMTKPRKAKDFRIGDPVNLYAEKNLMKRLWDNTLKGGLESMEGFVATLETFFNVNRITCNNGFKWEGWTCQPIQQVHVMTGSEFMPSFGLLMEKEEHKSVYFTTDSQHCSPRQVKTWYERADIIFQDCEISPFLSGVHANYIELAGYEEANAEKLSEEIKGKMWLSHYQDFYNQGKKQVIKSPTFPFYEAPENQEEFSGFIEYDWDNVAKIDGFAGFTYVGQAFEV